MTISAAEGSVLRLMRMSSGPSRMNENPRSADPAARRTRRGPARWPSRIPSASRPFLGKHAALHDDFIVISHRPQACASEQRVAVNPANLPAQMHRSSARYSPRAKGAIQPTPRHSAYRRQQGAAAEPDNGGRRGVSCVRLSIDSGLRVAVQEGHRISFWATRPPSPSRPFLVCRFRASRSGRYHRAA